MAVSSSDARYEKLDDAEIDEESIDLTASLLPIKAHNRSNRYMNISKPALTALLGVSCLLNVIIALAILYVTLYKTSSGILHTQPAYSPAQDAVSYKPVTFITGFAHDISIYQKKPSPEVDQAWVDLYDTISIKDWGIFRMNRDDASRLLNKTYPYPGDPGYYIGELAVSHQLHCLNRLRQGLSLEYYKNVYGPEEFEEEDGTLGWGHISHCLESVRQALVCASDVSVIPWTWDSRNQRAAAYADNVHSCRDFDKIKSWGHQHHPVLKFDPNVYIEDDLARYV
ncbi:hypothetical protein N7456_011138 [Penicillium angulare]|uniref:Tat pathway signal sequence n=1 Tax=Penicillium angulare TaxID=116970 RepID=A0A9W9ET25_9EURO|nr:hypothetical protein N7456_011138 [Penicillium angulare]